MPVPDPGVSVIPQMAPVAEAAPARAARTSLFDMISSAQKVPVLQAKEAALPRNTNVTDEKAALEKIQQSWRRILEQVTAQRISLGAFLELGVPASLTDATLEICFDQGSGFQINSVNNQKTFIQEIITAETGYRLRLVCRKDESPALQEIRGRILRMPTASFTAPVNAMEATAEPDEVLKSNVVTANGATAVKVSEPLPNVAPAPAPVNGAAKPTPTVVAPKPQPPLPTTLNDLYQVYPAVKKLVEALDGELL